jgi:hypothetical protein
MLVKVVYAVADNTTVNAEFTCSSIRSSQIIPVAHGAGPAKIAFNDGLHDGKKIVTAQFSRVAAILIYDED